MTISFLAFILLMLSFLVTQYINSTTEVPDRIKVYKSQQILVLEKDGRVIQKYPASFGFQPGKKIQSGDGKTPEGTYSIIGKKHKSIFKHSLHISYPNILDREHATKLAVHPGNEITIHGTGNDPDLKRRMKKLHNWTRGCIGLHNHHIEELYRRVVIGTPIDIYP